MTLEEKREERRIKQKEYYASHPYREKTEEQKEKIRQSSRDWYRRNKERMQAVAKAYRESHREEIREISSRYYYKNHEMCKEKMREYYRKNREEINRKSKKRREEDPTWKARAHAYYIANKEKNRKED